MDMQKMMEQAQKMQSQMEQARKDAGDKTVQGTAGGGMVTVTANGRSEVLSVSVEKAVVDPEEIEMLQDLIVAATNQAIQRANDMMQSEVGKITSGLSMPGLF
jgi:DNA-binding YbaB/EbfC family protein